MATIAMFTRNAQTQTVSLEIEMAMDVTSMQITQTGAETMIQPSSTQCRCAALVAVATVKVKTTQVTMGAMMEAMMEVTMVATTVL